MIVNKNEESLNEKFNWAGLTVFASFIGLIILSGMFQEVRDYVMAPGRILNLVEAFIVLVTLTHKNEIKSFIDRHRSDIKSELGINLSESEKKLNEGFFDFIPNAWRKIKGLNILLNSTNSEIFRKVSSNQNIRGYLSQIISSNSSYQRMSFYNMIELELNRILDDSEKRELSKLKSYSFFRG